VTVAATLPICAAAVALIIAQQKAAAANNKIEKMNVSRRGSVKEWKSRRVGMTSAVTAR
jgi:hypothetical protein